MPTPLSRRNFLAAGGGAVAGAALGGTTPASAASSGGLAEVASYAGGAEADIEQALGWWPNPRNVWTPIGWKDHLFRYNVTYNGSVIAAPRPLGRTTSAVSDPTYVRDRLQLDMVPWGGWFTSGPMRDLYPGNFYVYREDYGLYGHGTQSWADHPTPVLQTDWAQSNGVVLRQSVFAHTLGGVDVETGKEPLFAWIRLSVESVNPLGTTGPIGFAIRVASAYYTQEYPYTFQDGVTLTGHPAMAPFPSWRRADPLAVGTRRGLKIWQHEGPRIGVLTSNAVPVFSQPNSSKYIYNLEVTLPPVQGAYTDLMVAMLPQYEPNFDRELALGYDANRYWSARPSTAATISTPERHVNELVKRNIQFSEIVAQKAKDPSGADQVTFLTGSYGYDVLWSTPTSMTSHMFLSLLGYHDVVAKHLRLYKDRQGTVKPPGDAYAQHPGYFSTPANLRSVDWITDHGAIMTAVSTHALMSGDQAFIAEWLPALVKACEFVKAACALSDPSSVPGLPPKAVSTDEEIQVQSVWNIAWLYKGLITTVRLLKRVGHARAAEFAGVASAMRTTFDQAFDAYGARQPKWKHPDGNSYPVYSVNLADFPAGNFGEAMRLDVGPMVLVWAGLMDGADPRMVKFADYFRHGPNVALYGDGNRKNALDRPVLIHEMSSCEPLYSWNVFHSWHSGDRGRFLEGLYSLMAGGMSPQTYIPLEHRHGMSASLGAQATATWLLRHAVIDDSLVDDELHLLRLCPQAWLSADTDTVFTQMPTIYGPITLRLRATSPTEVALTWSATWRQPPTKLLVHAPPGTTTLTINNTRHPVPTSGYIEIPA
ncbi:twin-arginine translocation signal domain-containing protein [Kribbella sp. NBC_01245]|uniref:hypothetical protein n=1 Tax=Kribbella sp. NBC_01245 TaxID=2903578 RepID=UPI002E2AAAC9|nr:hypothetical protein [Kribbella sp. NBC_01245]